MLHKVNTFYVTFVLQQYRGDQAGFVRELRGIWDILYPSGCWHDSYLTQAFQILPSVEIPKVIHNNMK